MYALWSRFVSELIFTIVTRVKGNLRWLQTYIKTIGQKRDKNELRSFFLLTFRDFLCSFHCIKIPHIYIDYNIRVHCCIYQIIGRLVIIILWSNRGATWNVRSPDTWITWARPSNSHKWFISYVCVYMILANTTITLLTFFFDKIYSFDVSRLFWRLITILLGISVYFMIIRFIPGT